MIEDRLKALDYLAQSRSLDQLEAAVWSRIAVQATQVRASKVVVAWQSAVLALALVSSIGIGAHAATTLPTESLDVFSPHGSLTPSSRLGGH